MSDGLVRCHLGVLERGRVGTHIDPSLLQVLLREVGRPECCAAYTGAHACCMWVACLKLSHSDAYIQRTYRWERTDDHEAGQHVEGAQQVHGRREAAVVVGQVPDQIRSHCAARTSAPASTYPTLPNLMASALAAHGSTAALSAPCARRSAPGAGSDGRERTKAAGRAARVVAGDPAALCRAHQERRGPRPARPPRSTRHRRYRARVPRPQGKPCPDLRQALLLLKGRAGAHQSGPCTAQAPAQRAHSRSMPASASQPCQRCCKTQRGRACGRDDQQDEAGHDAAAEDRHRQHQERNAADDHRHAACSAARSGSVPALPSTLSGRHL